MSSCRSQWTAQTQYIWNEFMQVTVNCTDSVWYKFVEVTVNCTDSVWYVCWGHSELHRLSLHRVQLEWTLRAAVTHMTCRSVVISQPRLTPITLGVAESTFFSLNKLPRSVILAPITFTPLSNRLLSTLYTLIVLGNVSYKVQCRGTTVQLQMMMCFAVSIQYYK